MLELRNCKKCGSLFKYNGFLEECGQCIAQEESEFLKIRNYLFENPGASLADVSQALQIPEKNIKKLLKTVRLENIENTNLYLECETCGTPIRTGNYCGECLARMSRDLKNTSNLLKAACEPVKIQYRYIHSNKVI